MSSTIIDAWSWAAGLILIKGTFLLIAGWIGWFLARRAGAAVKHFLLCAALGSMLLIPVLSILLPRWDVPIRPLTAVRQLPKVTDGLNVSTAPSRQLPPTTVNAAAVQRVATHTAPTIAVVAAPVRATIARPRMPDLRLAVFAIWWVGATWLFGRFLGAFLRLRTVVRCAIPIDNTDLVRRLSRATSTKATVLMSSLITVPITAGWFRPVIVLPANAFDWPFGRLNAVLLHEIAHVRRRDWLVEMLAQVICCLCWPQPLAWLTAKRLRLESELACDDAVILGGVAATEYATYLLDIAKNCSRRSTTQLGLAMANPSTLRGRLTAIVDPYRRRKSVPGKWMVALALAFMAFCLPVVAIQLSQAKPSDTPTLPSAESTASRVTLANGITVELQGLTSDDYGTLGDYWWSADGVTTQPPQTVGDRFHNIHPFEFSPRTEQPRVLSFKLTSPAAAKCSTTGYIVGMTNLVGGTGFFGADVRLNDVGLRAGMPSIGNVILGFDKPTQQFTYRFGVASGPWKTVSSIAVPVKINPKLVNEQDRQYGPYDNMIGGIALFLGDNPVLEYRDKSFKYHSYPLLPSGQTLDSQARRLFVYDRMGKEIPVKPNPYVGASDPYYMMRAVDFARVARIVVQARPYQWAEFKNVAVDRIPTAAAPADVAPIPTPEPLPAYSVTDGPAKVALIAVAGPKAEGGRWWLPNGNRLKAAIYEYRMLGIPSKGSGKMRSLVFSVTSTRPVDLSLSAHILDESGNKLEGLENRDFMLTSDFLRSGLGTNTAFLPGEATCRVNLAESVSGWENVALAGFDPSAVSHFNGKGKRNLRCDVLIWPDNSPELMYVDLKGGMVTRSFRLLAAHPTSSYATRVVAAMRNGAIKPLQTNGGGAQGEAVSLSFDPASFMSQANPDVDLAKVKAFMVQTRPMHSFEIANVHLDPAT